MGQLWGLESLQSILAQTSWTFVNLLERSFVLMSTVATPLNRYTIELVVVRPYLMDVPGSKLMFIMSR